MKKAVIPVLLIMALTLAGCAANGAAETEIEERVTPVETTQAGSAEISRELVYAGQVKPEEQVMVLPKLGGKVTAIYFDVGDSVKKDDVLFEIDDTDIKSSINAAEASYSASLAGVSTARASLESVSGAQSQTQVLQLETAVKNAEIGVVNAEIALADAKTALDNVATSYENAKVLFAAGTMSKTDFDGIELKYNQALSGYDKAQNGKTQAETALAQASESYELYISKTYGTSVRQAQSGVNQAAAGAEATRVSLENAQRNLEDLKVKSPITGVISAKNVTVGQMAGQTSPAFTVISIETVEINTSVSEELINVISPGMSVPVYINSAGAEPFDGVISTISPAADELKNIYPVNITVANPDGKLKPGMFAEVHFTKEKSENAVVMPRSTVLDEDGNKYVFVAENDRAKKYFVETGIDNGKEIEITGGLPQNAQIITKGQTQVADGEKIKIVGAK